MVCLLKSKQLLPAVKTAVKTAGNNQVVGIATSH